MDRNIPRIMVSGTLETGVPKIIQKIINIILNVCIVFSERLDTFLSKKAKKILSRLVFLKLACTLLPEFGGYYDRI